ncbi:MAG TPA: NUDIX domain-containing protein [Reyranella sp.]|nr:NUDIX domain-containing protein [Reyranella sp.]
MAKFGLIADLHLILRQDGKVLLGLRRNTGFADGLYHLPAGHLEPDEPIAAGAAREAREELGIDIRLADLELVHTMHHRSGLVAFFFEVLAWSGEIGNAEPDKCERLDWLAADDWPRNSVRYARAALDRIRSGQRFSTFGWDEAPAEQVVA